MGWFTALIDSNRLPEARGLLHAMKQSKVNGSMTEWCEAEIELHNGDLKGAISRLEQAVKVDTTSGNLRLLLGYAYAKDGKLSLARDAYQQALGCLLHQDDVIGARQSLLEVDKALGTTGNR